MFQAIRAAAHSLAELAFPEPGSSETLPRPISGTICHQCGEPLPIHSEASADSDEINHTQELPIICSTCSDLTWHFELARAEYRTTGRVREAITGFKYRGEYHRRRELIQWLIEAYDRFFKGTSFTHLVPVPLHRLRRRMRGFNQALVLAEGLVRARNHLQIHDVLLRNYSTSSQASLNRKDRLNNIGQSIQLKPKFDVKGLHLLIIDDVFTTGATAEACAQVLSESGAARLAVLTISRR